MPQLSLNVALSLKLLGIFHCFTVGGTPVLIVLLESGPIMLVTQEFWTDTASSPSELARMD